MTDSLHKYTITVDSTQASAAITSVEGALKRSESAAVSAGLALDKAFVVESKSITKADLAIHNLEESLKKFNLEAQRVEGSFTGVTTKATDWGKAANALKERTEKGAAAMAILASTMGNTESAGGKLIAGAGTLAATYGAGGPWMVALVAGAYTIELYTKKQYELLAAEEKIFDNRADLVAQQHALTDALGASKREAADAVTLLSVPEKARDALKIGMEQARQDAEIRAKLNAAERNHQDDVAGILRSQLKTNAEITLKKLTALNMTKDQAEAEKHRLEFLEKMAKLQTTQAEDASKTGAAFREKSGGGEETKSISAVITAEKANRQAIERLRDNLEQKDIEYLAKLSDKAIEDYRKDEALKLEYSRRRQEEVEAGEKAMHEQMKQMALGSYAIIAGASQQLVSDLITGQDHAVEHFATAIMAQAGQSLIASSVKLAGEATVSAFTPGLQPLAIAQGSAAAGLFAGGLALGGLAVGAEHVMAGGTIGQKLPDQKSGTPAGFGGRSSGGSQGSGTNVTIVYSGASGPSADDGARAVTMALTLAQRRGQYNSNLDRRF